METTKNFELLKYDELLIQNVPIRRPGPWRAWGYVILDHGPPERARAGPIPESRSLCYLYFRGLGQARSGSPRAVTARIRRPGVR